MDKSTKNFIVHKITEIITSIPEGMEKKDKVLSDLISVYHCVLEEFYRANHKFEPITEYENNDTEIYSMVD